MPDQILAKPAGNQIDVAEKPGHKGSMRSYIIAPSFKLPKQVNDRTCEALRLVADLVFESLRCGGDWFQHTVEWLDPGKEPGSNFHEDIAEPHLFDLRDEQVLRDWLYKSVDPYVPGGGQVRSAATCRCVTFGYDGQALLCLRHEDEPPTSPDPDLVIVEERPELVKESDWFDGWARSDAL